MRQFIEDWLKVFEIPDPSALAVWSPLPKIFRDKPHHLKEQGSRGIGVVICRDDLARRVSIGGSIPERIGDQLQCVGEITPAHVSYEIEPISRLWLTLIAEPTACARLVIETKSIFSATCRAWSVVLRGCGKVHAQMG